MKNRKNQESISLSLLLVAFVVLKLCGVIDWPWVWVLSPVWIPLILAVVIAGVVLLFYFIKDKWEDKRLDAEAKKLEEELERKKKPAKAFRDMAERSNT